jgi:hypothetical protein
MPRIEAGFCLPEVGVQSRAPIALGSGLDNVLAQPRLEPTVGALLRARSQRQAFVLGVLTEERKRSSKPKAGDPRRRSSTPVATLPMMSARGRLVAERVASRAASKRQRRAVTSTP